MATQLETIQGDLTIAGGGTVNLGTGPCTTGGPVYNKGPGGTKPINVETIAATRTIAIGTDAQIHVLTSVADQDVVFSSDACAGYSCEIACRGLGKKNVKNAAGTLILQLTTPQSAVYTNDERCSFERCWNRR